MKEELIGKHKKGLPQIQSRGFATVEIVLAFAVLIISLSAVVLVSLGNQSMTVDNETNNEAILKAQTLIEEARAGSRENFNSVKDCDDDVATPIPNCSGTADPFYSRKLTIPPASVTECAKDVVSSISWVIGSRTLNADFVTRIGNVPLALALGGDCLIDLPGGGWSIPQTLISRDLIPPGTPATNLDVLDKMIYLTVKPSVPNQNDLFVVDGTDFNAMLAGTQPPIIQQFNTGYGLNAVEVVKFNSLGKTYAYAVGYSEDAAGNCGLGPQKPYLDQLEVIDVTTMTPVSSRTLTGIVPCGSYPAGYSVYYYDNKLYVGTKDTAGSELTIFDLSVDPANPIEIDNIEITRNINAIVVRDGLAYLATGPGAAGTHNPLKIFNVTPGPGYLTEVGSFIATGDEQGTALYIVGDKLYLGLERTPPGSPRPNFYILDIEDPTASPLPKLGEKYIPLQNNTAVTGIRVAGGLAFLTYSDPNKGFQVFDISGSNEANPLSISTYNFSQATTGIDYENGFIYTSNKSNDALRIIRPAECSDTLDDDLDSKIDDEDPDCHTDGDANNAASYDTEDNDES